MSSLPVLDHERVVSSTGPRSGVTITVALHSSVLGPALGGCRLWTYDSWVDSISDALRLSSAMTLKNAAAGLDAGGGKSVMALAPGEALDAGRRRDALLDLGNIVESFGGLYRTAEDVGTTEDDMLVVAERTAHVVGLPSSRGGSGEPAVPTALGVYAALRATLEEVFGSSDVAGRSIIVSGLGQVGSRLATRLAADGANLIVSDLNPARRSFAAELGAEWVDVDVVLDRSADVLVPAGVGGVVTDAIIPTLDVRAIVGPANNPLASRDIAQRLADRGILYAPDFIANAGGVIYLALAAEGANADLIDARVRGIASTLARVFATARANRTTPLAAAEGLALERIDRVRGQGHQGRRS